MQAIKKQSLTLTAHLAEGTHREIFPLEDPQSAVDAWAKYIARGIYATIEPTDTEVEAKTDAQIADEARIELKALLATVKSIGHNLQGRHLPCHARLDTISSLVQDAINDLKPAAGADTCEWF